MRRMLHKVGPTSPDLHAPIELAGEFADFVARFKPWSVCSMQLGLQTGPLTCRPENERMHCIGIL